MTPKQRAASLTLGMLAKLAEKGITSQVTRFGRGKGHRCTVLVNGREYAWASASTAAHAQLTAWTRAFEVDEANARRIVQFAEREGLL